MSDTVDSSGTHDDNFFYADRHLSRKASNSATSQKLSGTEGNTDRIVPHLRLSDGVSDTVKKLERPARIRQDPFDRLPYEPFVQIIELAAISWEGRLSKDDAEISVDLLLSLSLVSRHWQTAILGTPRLWHHIDLRDYNGKPDGAAKLHLSLTFAKEAPLTVSIGYESLTAETRDVITAIAERIFTFYIYSARARSNFMGEEGLKTLIAIIHQAKYPSLTRICFGGYATIDSEDMTTISSAIPDLQTLKRVRFESTEVQIPPGVELEDVWVRLLGQYNAKAIRNIIDACDEVTIAGSWNEEPDDAKWEPSHLTSLHVMDWEPWSLSELSLMKFSDLVTLQVRCSGSLVLNLTKNLHTLANLNRLDIAIVGKVENSANPPSHVFEDQPIWDTIPANASIASLVLKIDGGVRMGYLAECANIFARCTPNIEVISVRPQGKSVFTQWSWGSSFPRLSSVTCSSGVQSQIRRLRRTLALDSSYSPNAPGVIRPTQNVHDPREFRNLRILDISQHTRIHWDRFELVSLRELSLHEPHDGWGEKNCVPFCLYLASNPKNIPQLRKLGLHGEVEMDILFIALEARNLARHDVARIDTVILPGPCSPRYFTALTSILSGTHCPRPSNYELSLAGNREEYNDWRIMGCDCCHRLLRHCVTPIEGLREAKHPATLNGMPSVYSMDVAELLNTWENRHNEWIESTTIERKPMCETAKSNSGEISWYSLEDPLNDAGTLLSESEAINLKRWHRAELAKLQSRHMPYSSNAE